MSSLEKLQCQNLAIGYSAQKPLFEKIDLSLHNSEVVCIMGANGVGKSTFLKTLCGQLEPLAGGVYFNEQNLSTLSSTHLAKLVSIVQSSTPLFHPSLKVSELLAFSRSPYTSFWGRLGAEDKMMIEQTAQSCQIQDLLYRELSSLSDGQRQKVMIARALVQQTPLILLDEPTTYLDLKNQISILLLLKRLASEFKKTIIFTSHHWELILELATKVWYFDESTSVIEQTTPEDFILTKRWQRYLDLDIAQFDEGDGRFKLNACDAYPVQIYGEESTQKKWTAHHLIKHGFYASDESSLKCLVKDQKWVVEIDSRTLEASSILECVELLKSLSV